MTFKYFLDNIYPDAAVGCVVRVRGLVADDGFVEYSTAEVEV